MLIGPNPDGVVGVVHFERGRTKAGFNSREEYYSSKIY